jgi:phosphate transport system permease protein
MLVGAVKLAPELPLDAVPPFVHAQRSFMHLGFHVYDLGFQSPDSDAARPMVFATTLLLIFLVVCLNLGAIWIRNRLRARFKGASF